MTSTTQQEETSTSPLSTYFTTKQWLYFALIVIVGIGLRWFELETRPFHHDESQHAMFGKYFFDFPEIQYYKYDPMMHAPLLYNFFRLVYTAFGNTLWASRAPIAMIGTLFLIVPLIFRRYFTPTALLALTAAISFSSNMVYWSRFVIHDYFVISAMLLSLYGVVRADPKRKSIFLLLGFTLQFCIKANVFVTAAIIAGYLIFEAGFQYFVIDKNSQTLTRFLRYLLKYSLYFLGFFAFITILIHYTISHVQTDNKDWAGLLQFSQNVPIFIAAALILSIAAYAISFFIFERNVQETHQPSLLARSVDNILANKWQFLVAVSLSVLIFCYIFSSGFRNNQGILDGLFYKSIPYWLNQHNIERIKGPLLFNFYMFSWYEFPLLVFFIIHLYIFYKNVGKIAKLAGLSSLLAAVLLGLSFLVYISPEDANQNWRSIEDIGGKNIADLKSTVDVVATWFVHLFKLKDCLDVFAILLLIAHPVILTATHLSRREGVMAFWGYYFTASFFAYSFLGEKVPWLSVYPLIPALVYLTLFFDDYFKKNPIQNYANYPWQKIFNVVALTSLSLGIFFVVENIVSISAIFGPDSFSKFYDIFSYKGLKNIYASIYDGVKDNLLLFLLGLVLYLISYTNKWTDLCGKVNLKNLLFVVVSIFCIRGAILTNFVYAGSETELISQVHTTKEFHELALRLRQEALTNIRPDNFKILGDGDPVWPLTWYMVGVNDFKFTANPEERKTYDVILQTYEENPKNVPEGFVKRKVNLRGWWVPDFNQMTLKKFLNVSVNHFPWSPSGFTYVWLLINPNKGFVKTSEAVKSK